ncbi:hypothetical protein CYMTET_31787, partial [Cymbomonas tetramitiformis]
MACHLPRSKGAFSLSRDLTLREHTCLTPKSRVCKSSTTVDVCDFSKAVPTGLRVHRRNHKPSAASGALSLSAATQDRGTLSDFGNAGVKVQKDLDVVALSNLCVDVVQPVASLPPEDPEARQRVFTELTSTIPDIKQWEVGGSTNFAIAAARIGLKTVCLGHTGPDVYGKFVKEVLEAEGVELQQIAADAGLSENALRTLLCWVLVDPSNNHAFCSRFDFKKTPFLSGYCTLASEAKHTIQRSKALMMNGFMFDELEMEAVQETLDIAKEAGTALFFDVGPRGANLKAGVPAGGVEALDLLLTQSDVVLLTHEEAVDVTGIRDAAQAAQSLLERPGKWPALFPLRQ